MNIGKKTVLLGAHQFVLHPYYVAKAWNRLYPWPRQGLSRLALLSAFIVHDFGYLTLRADNLDGPEGERHVEFGAELMTRLFGKQWGDFTRYHSRYYSRAAGVNYSRLCAADKLAPALMPDALYKAQVKLSGEVWEYVYHYHHGKYREELGAHAASVVSEADLAERKLTPHTQAAIDEWHTHTMSFLRDWAYEHAAHADPEPQHTPLTPALRRLGLLALGGVALGAVWGMRQWEMSRGRR